ncbi:MAG TPA: PEP/pyruvate-binding domain-containing protein [Bryobacteraceae bacterium]|nr:PEP/pyruvate-binding domain-containing protein [Bryobacteraceae bacterium]
MARPSKDLYEIGQGALTVTSAKEVGNKAWNLMRMAAAGLPVPAGFVLPTRWAKHPVDEVLAAGIAGLEKKTGLGFGSCRRPLLVSVRSGSAVSMPGMLETVLDIGLNAESVEGLIRQTGNPKLAWDCYRRLIQGYAEVVHGLAADPFDELVAQAVSSGGVEGDRDLDFRALRQLARDMTNLFEELAGEPFPADPRVQLRNAAEAVFRSWNSPKAVAYRRLNRIGNHLGTAVTVQTMVFGNAGGESGAGVGFTRDPASGEPGIYLDFRFNGQGEDVVAGRHRTQDREQLRRMLPAVWQQIESICRNLEAIFRDAQDFEFTLQNGVLYLLQSRDAKRTDWAALRIAVDLVEEGLIDACEAQRRLAGIDLETVSRRRFEKQAAEALAQAEAASIGVVSGAIALDCDAVERIAKEGKTAILVRRDIATDDIRGIARAGGVLTSSGSRTSHAAVVARQLEKVCLVGCASLEVDAAGRCCRIGERTLHEGDVLSLDGNEGCVYSGTLEAVTERPERELAAIAGWDRSLAVEAQQITAAGN